MRDRGAGVIIVGDHSAAASAAIAPAEVSSSPMGMNRQLIVPLFQALVKHRRKLGFLLPEEGEAPDVRRYTAEVIRAFPWPLGVELRRLSSAGLERPGRARLDQILKVVERAAQILNLEHGYSLSEYYWFWSDEQLAPVLRLLRVLSKDDAPGIFQRYAELTDDQRTRLQFFADLAAFALEPTDATFAPLADSSLFWQDTEDEDFENFFSRIDDADDVLRYWLMKYARGEAKAWLTPEHFGRFLERQGLLLGHLARWRGARRASLEPERVERLTSLTKWNLSQIRARPVEGADLEALRPFFPAYAFDDVERLNEAGDHAAAQALLRGVLERFPLDYKARRDLSWSLADSGDIEGALALSREVIADWPDQAYPRIGVLHALYAAERWAALEAEGRALLDDLVSGAVQPHEKAEREALLYVREALQTTDRGHEAVALSERWLERHPDDARGWGSLSWYRILYGDGEAAVEAAERGLALDPDVHWIATNLMHGRWMMGDREAAMAVLRAHRGHVEDEGRDFATIVLDDYQVFREEGVAFPDLDEAERAVRATMTP